MIFIVVIEVTTAFLVAFLLSGCLIRFVICEWVVQCGLHVLAEIFKVSQDSGCGFEVLNLHFPLSFDWDSEFQ